MVTNGSTREDEMPRTRPTETPPATRGKTTKRGATTAETTGAAGTTQPKPITGEQLADVLEAEAEIEGRPTLDPTSVTGGAAQAQAVAAVTGTWQTGVTVTALWSINEIRNAWFHGTGIGWRKIYNGREGSFRALVALASHARQTGRPINFRQEADGMVYEIYVW
jgi:hypothetical protein